MKTAAWLNYFIRSCFVAAAFALALAGCGGGGGGGGGGGATGGGATGAVTLTGISISPAAPTTAKGLSAKFTATGTYNNGTTGDISGSVVWSSSNTAVATINASGTASTLAVGTSDIGATLSGIISPLQTLTVTAPVLANLSVTPSSASVVAGNTKQFTASGTLTDGTAATLGTVTWTSSNTAVATINASGLATGVSKGSASISASSGGITSNLVNLNVVQFMGGAMQGAPLNLTAAVTTFAGSGTAGAVDGNGTAASFNRPYGVTTDGTNLYVADQLNSSIRKIVIATGAVTTLAAAVGSVNGITTDGTNLYVTDDTNNIVRKIVIATGAVTTLAGAAGVCNWFADGVGAAATFCGPSGITTDGTNLYVADSSNYRIRKIVIATGAVTTLAGSGAVSSVDGIGTAAAFGRPTGVTTDGTNLYVADAWLPKIRKIVIATAAVTTLAGTGVSGAADGIGTAATFQGPYNLTTDGTNLYVSDYNNYNIRKIAITTAAVTTLAGSGVAGAADGTGSAASFYMPYGITSDGTSLYVTDVGNYKIRKIQ